TAVTGPLDLPLHAEHVGHAMHVGLVHCHGSLPLRGVARIMAAHRIHAVVVDAEAGEDRPAVVSDLAAAAASCPHAASMSRPRVSRTVAGRRAVSSTSLNAEIAF